MAEHDPYSPQYQQNNRGDEMTVEPGTDMSADKLFNISWGLIFKVVCAPKSWDATRVSDEATRMDPPGTSVNRWVVSDPDEERDAPFKGCNHTQCNDDPNRVHWLVNC